MPGPRRALCAGKDPTWPRTVAEAWIGLPPVARLAGQTEAAAEVRLPDPALNVGRVIEIKKASSDGHVVTVSSAGGGTIEGSNYYYLNYQYEAVTMISVNDDWYVF